MPHTSISNKEYNKMKKQRQIILFETEEDKANYINEIIEFNQDYYQYDHMAVIVGDDETYGDDEREVILSNARVIYVIK